MRALILACPASTTIRNKEGYLPVELARINYGRDQEGTGSLTIRGASASSALPSRSSGYRRDVLELLDDRENGFLDMAMRELLSKTAPAVPSSWMPLAMPRQSSSSPADRGQGGGGDGDEGQGHLGSDVGTSRRV